MYLYDRNMEVTINHKYANSSLNYYVVMAVQKDFTFQNRKFPFHPHFRGTNARVEVNNSREAVVILVRNVVKRPSKRSALVRTIVFDLSNLLSLHSR